jgi:putative transposase
MPSTYSNLLYHIVFSTKDRERLITEEFKEELYRYMAGITREEGGTLLEIGGIEDHVHLLAKFKPSIAASDMLRLIKTNSSKWMREVKGHARFGWQEGYAAFSVSESLVVAVRRYIRNQAMHHRRQSFQEEFVAMLERHGVEYDPRYLWD